MSLSHLPAQPQLFPMSNNIKAYNPNPVYAVIDTLLVNVSACFLLIPYPNNVGVSIFFQLNDKSMLNKLRKLLKYALAYISTSSYEQIVLATYLVALIP